MINVVNKTIENTIYCPKNLTETEVNFVFDIHSEITNKSYVFEVIDQSSGSSYYKFNVLFDEVPDGEYNWYVLLSGETRSEGLIRIGNWNPASNGTAYHLIQYDAAGYSPIDLQTKQVEINSEGLTTIEPDNGFVGLKEVQVYVDVPNEYEEGFEDGEAAQKAKLIALEVTANGRYEREDGYNQVDVDVDTTPYYESGYTAGYEAGYESGSTEGSEEGYESGYTAGVEAGEAQQKAKLITTAITENGTYAREDGYSSVSVDVPTTVNNQNKTVEYTENGTYIVVPAAGYSGLGSVTINTNVPHTGHTDAEMEQAYQSGYTSGETVGYESGYTSGETVGYASGKTDGVAEQKAKLVTTAVTENGTYSRADGYSSVTVNVPQTGSTINNQNKTVPITTNGTTAVTFDAGYTGLGTVTINTNVPTGSTINNQDKSLSFTANTTTIITADAGYTGLGNVALDINIPQTGHTDAELEAAYSSGVTEGMEEQKALLVTTAVTANGTYTRENGFSSIEVNVPTGETINNQDKTVSYDTNGTYTVTADSGYTGLGTVTVNVATTGSTPSSSVSVTLMNTTLIGQAGFNFTYDGGSTAYTFDTATVTIGDLLPGMDCTITYTTVPGYTKPDAETIRTKYNSSVQAFGLYTTSMNSEYFTVKVNSSTNGTLKMPSYKGTLEYSKNSGEWTSLATGDTVTVETGDLIQLRGTATGACGSIQVKNASYEVYGNIGSLINPTPAFFSGGTNAAAAYQFGGFFVGQTGLTNAQNLIINVNPDGSQQTYDRMFWNCTLMEYGPASIDIETAPEWTFSEMFCNCSNMRRFPDLSNIQINGGTSHSFRGMFSGCTAASGTVILNCDSAGGMSEMFYGCRSLNGVELNISSTPANGSAYNMFYNCASLSYVKCLFTGNITAGKTQNWLYGVASTGTFIKNPNATWETGTSGIPSGWTVEDAS